jgi:hypothetical protein
MAAEIPGAADSPALLFSPFSLGGCFDGGKELSHKTCDILLNSAVKSPRDEPCDPAWSQPVGFEKITLQNPERLLNIGVAAETMEPIRDFVWTSTKIAQHVVA